MKKRRDLDALVNGKLGGRRKKNGQHELLRNTDSSDIEEFAIPPQNLARKHRSTSRFCSTCLAVCGFFLLTACAVAVAGLVWVHIELKKDVDLLQIRLSTVEGGNAGNSNEFQDVHARIRQFTDDIQELKTKAESFTKNFTSVWNKLNQLSSQKQVPSTSPEVADMKKTVASLGSELESLKASTRIELDQLQKTLSASDQVTPQMSQSSLSDLVSIKTDVFGIQHSMTLLNTTFLQSISNLRRERELVASQLNTSLVKLEDRLSILELKPITEPTIDRSMIQDTIHEAVQDALMSVTDKNQQVSDIEAVVNNITLEMDALKAAKKYFNTSISTSQQQLMYLDHKVEEQEKRLVTLENLPLPSKAAPSDGGLATPKPSSPDASTEKKSGSPLSTPVAEAPSQEKPTPVPVEEAEADGDTSRSRVPIPPGVGSDGPKTSGQDEKPNNKDLGLPVTEANVDGRLPADQFNQNYNDQGYPANSGNAKDNYNKNDDDDYYNNDQDQATKQYEKWNY